METIYTAKQEAIQACISLDEPVNVAADGRCDSPGHSALYGITTMMDAKTKLVIASHLVKVNLLTRI